MSAHGLAFILFRVIRPVRCCYFERSFHIPVPLLSRNLGFLNGAGAKLYMSWLREPLAYGRVMFILPGGCAPDVTSALWYGVVSMDVLGLCAHELGVGYGTRLPSKPR